MNGAGLVATHETNGVIVDNTPPVVSNIALSFFHYQSEKYVVMLVVVSLVMIICFHCKKTACRKF